MANLTETEIFDAGVYQLETTDPVLGGPGGVANRQAQSLGNRTKWLKAQIDIITSLLSSGVQPLDALLTALSNLTTSADKMAYFTGADTVALATITGFARTLLDDSDASGALTTLGVSTYIKTLLNDADAATARTTLGVDGAISAAVSALVNSSPSTLDTLKELADALGSDPNFATTMTNALAAKAPLADPTFTGTPAAPTRAQFTDNTALATTAFVKRALGSFASASYGLANGASIAAAHIGAVSQPDEGATITVPTPANVGCESGDAFTIFMGARAAATLNAGAGSSFYHTSTLSTLALTQGEVVTLVASGAGWYVHGKLAGQAQFGSSLAASGYQKLPSGLILQWGLSSSISRDSYATITLPITFPAAAVLLSATARGNTLDSGGENYSVSTYPVNTSSFRIYNDSAQNQVYWFAIGY